MASNLARRLTALEIAKRTAPSINRHCLMWWPGQSWAEVLAGYGADRLKPGHRVTLLRFEAAGSEPDAIQERDAPVASSWFKDMGIAHA